MKVYKHNNWEHIRYTFDGKELPAQKGTVILEDGSELPLIVRHNTSSYIEQGRLHPTNVDQRLLMVEGSFRDFKVEIPIEKFTDIKEIRQ